MNMPFPDPMHIEQLKDVHTPEEMRAEIHRLARERSSVLVRSVMDCADFNGLSAEDRYTMLAYHALRDLARYQKVALNQLVIKPPHHFVAENPPGG
jgi:hypothetical protein